MKKKAANRAETRAANPGRARSASSSRMRRSGSLALLLDDRGEQGGIDVAAGEHGGDGLALEAKLARKNGGERDGAARLEHQLQLLESIAHGSLGLLVCYGEAADEVAPGPLDGE